MNLKITTGVSEDDQLSSFQNATLQGAGAFAFSIATHVTVPDTVIAEGEAAVAKFVEDALVRGDVAFEVQIGSASA